MKKTPATTPTPAAAPAADDPMKPNIGLLIKLGSIIVHTEELLEQQEVKEFFATTPLNLPSQFDRGAMEPLLADPQVREWVEKMSKQGFLPIKRS